MDEPGSPVFQAFCTACKNELDVSVLEPLETFVCKRCLTIQSFGENQLRPSFVDPLPRRIMLAFLLVLAAVDILILWRIDRSTGVLGALPVVAFATLAASPLFFLRVKSPPLNAGFAMLSFSVLLAFIVMRGFPAGRHAQFEEWTTLVFLLAAVLCLGLVFFVGEFLRISRTTRA